MAEAGKGQQAFDLGLAQGHQVADQHIDCAETSSRIVPHERRNVRKRTQRPQHGDQTGFDDDTGKHGADAAGSLRMGIRQPGVHGNQGRFDAETDDEQSAGSQQSTVMESGSLEHAHRQV